MGTIAFARPAGRRTAPARVLLEEITAADDIVTGHEADAFFAHREYLHHISDANLLAGCPPRRCSSTNSRCPASTAGRLLGASVRRPGGPGAVIGVDKVSRALLVGCRGEVPLGTLIDLLAAFHDVDAEALATAALPMVREAIGRGIVYQAD